jgi:transposase
MITLPAKTHIWIAAGVTDLRRGFDGLSALVQTKLEQSPFSGHVFVFRGRRGDLIKVLWWDGDGLCLFAKRLERGRFVWSQASVITSKAANSYHFKTGQRDWPSRTEIVLPCRLLWRQVGFRAPAPRAALEHMPVV